MTSDGPVECPIITKADIYLTFAQRYGWDANRVKKLTPAQQYVYLGKSGDPGDLHNMGDLQVWRMLRSMSKQMTKPVAASRKHDHR